MTSAIEAVNVCSAGMYAFICFRQMCHKMHVYCSVAFDTLDSKISVRGKAGGQRVARETGGGEQWCWERREPLQNKN